MGYTESINSSLNKLFSDTSLSKPLKIIYTKTKSGSNLNNITTETVVLKKDMEYIRGFFKDPMTGEGVQVVSSYDGEILLNDITFDLQSVSFSKGIFDTFQSTDTLEINDTVIDMTLITDINSLITAISGIVNVFCFKLSEIEFLIISSVADFENDIDYKDLKIEGTCLDIFGLDALSKKATMTIKMNGITYSVSKIFNGDYIKSVYVNRG